MYVVLLEYASLYMLNKLFWIKKLRKIYEEVTDLVFLRFNKISEISPIFIFKNEGIIRDWLIELLFCFLSWDKWEIWLWFTWLMHLLCRQRFKGHVCALSVICSMKCVNEDKLFLLSWTVKVYGPCNLKLPDCFDFSHRGCKIKLLNLW